MSRHHVYHRLRTKCHVFHVVFNNVGLCVCYSVVTIVKPHSNSSHKISLNIFKHYCFLSSFPLFHFCFACCYLKITGFVWHLCECAPLFQEKFMKPCGTIVKEDRVIWKRTGLKWGAGCCCCCFSVFVWTFLLVYLSLSMFCWFSPALLGNIIPPNL